jgi:hypothetical protein
VKPQSKSRTRIGLSLKGPCRVWKAKHWLNASDAAVRRLKDRSQEKANKFLTYNITCNLTCLFMLEI